jgi:hypothetical protein
MRFPSLRNRVSLGSIVLLAENIFGHRILNRKIVENPLQTDVPVTLF